MQQRLEFITSRRSHIQSITATTFEVCHASKGTVVPHIIKAQKIVDPYIQVKLHWGEPI